MSGRHDGSAGLQAMAEDIEALEMQCDTLALRLARYETANDERIPGAVIHRLSDGEHPVRVWREHRGLDLAAVAGASALPMDLLTAIETGEQEPTLRMAVAIARALGIDAEDLVPWSQEDDTQP